MSQGKSGWQFPDNNCTTNNGLDDTGTETFAGDSNGNLAREICQNSIDANNGFGEPSVVEFQYFEIKTESIPGRDDLQNEINECFDYKGKDAKEGTKLNFIKNTIEKNTIGCLRISDFNTTGLVGIAEDENDSPFFLLTKGSGTSGKIEGSGGSKGIGKFASFVASDLRTVFYSTKAFNKKKNNVEKGHIGIAKLRSRSLHRRDRINLMTMGTGYYAANVDNAPFPDELYLDPNFKRDDEQYGTDIYLIGFSAKNWEADVAYKILEGFMGAIIFSGFEAIVGDYRLNKDSIKEIIYSDLFAGKSINEMRYLKAQYSLFTDEDVMKNEFYIAGKNKVTVYVKTYAQKNESEASKRCEFIRYPYMRIKCHGFRTVLPYSAMCIVENNDLCEKLRSIEDPTHSDWQFDRLSRYNSDKKIYKKIHEELINTVKNYIQECLKQDVGECVEFEGASEYLPSDENYEYGDSSNTKDAITTTPIRRVNVSVPKTNKLSEENEGPAFGDGEVGDGDMDMHDLAVNEGSQPNPNLNPKTPIDDEQKGAQGNQVVLTKKLLGGMKYKTIYDSKNKKLDVVFQSAYDEENCELIIKAVGLNNDKFDVMIKSAIVNGKICEVEDGIIKKLKIEKNTKYKISCEITSKDKFASEVVLNAIR